VTTSYVRLIKTHPAEGWVRGRYAESADYGENVATLLEQNQALERELAALRSAGRFDTRGLSSGADSVSVEYKLGMRCFRPGLTGIAYFGL
jgi:hypothetical protein